MHHIKRWLLLGAAAVLLFVFRQHVWQSLSQLLCGVPLALAALPLMRVLERKCSPGVAAALSMAGLGGAVLLAIVLVLPAFARQGQRLLEVLPSVSGRLMGMVNKGESWLRRYGLPAAPGLRQQLVLQGEAFLGKAAPAIIGWVQQLAGSFGRWMLAPVFAFYYLRDRRAIGEWLLHLMPPEKRGLSVQLMREIGRETAGYLRGQLTLSLVVGGLTAAGLFLCGVESWLLLGAVMGVMELIPYVGPLLGGAVVVLFSLQAGLGRTLWAMAVVLVVQQLEGGWLSPKVMSDATKLHPIAVLGLMGLGGSIGGVLGLLVAVPGALCLRAVLRVYVLGRAGQ